MTPSRLERRYRSLLALYPRGFRQEHEEEILAVLMAAAPEGRQRPRLAESADLVRSAILMRLRQTKVPTTWEYRHVGLMLPMRIVTAVWFVVLMTMLYTSGRGGWWGAVLVPATILHLYIAYCLVRRPDRRERL
jgi:hypothetical protein